MGKKKLIRWEELKSFDNVFELDTQHKGKWNQNFFKNENTIVLELGCGRGEYSIGLAKKYPDKNFIGIDIKGARLWRGAKTAIEEKMQNVAFLRTQIDHIEEYFDKNEVGEIWITFPDPQLQDSKEKKRLTSPRFLNRYKNISSPDTLVHLKTDSEELYLYTKELLLEQGNVILYDTDNLYSSSVPVSELEIKTTYEKIFLDKGKTIKYLRFKL